MKPVVEDQLTTEGELICGALIVAAMVEAGRIASSDSTDAEANKVLRQLVAAMGKFRAEVELWPDADN